MLRSRLIAALFVAVSLGGCGPCFMGAGQCKKLAKALPGPQCPAGFVSVWEGATYSCVVPPGDTANTLSSWNQYSP